MALVAFAAAAAVSPPAPSPSSSLPAMACVVRQSPLRSRVAVAAKVTAAAASQSSVGSAGGDTGVFQKLPMVQVGSKAR